MKHPILYHKGKNGELRQWSVWTEGPDIVTEYGQVGGAMQLSRKTAVGKNVGRSNETNPKEQAESEAESLFNFKLERKYSRTKEEASEELELPMLAHKYEDKKKNVTFPASVQPKLDGVRCLAYWKGNKVVLMSRSGKPYTVPTVSSQLEKWLPKDMTLDGELYVHGMSCQSITSLVKKWKPESEQLIYNVYDVPVYSGDDSLPWKKRFEHLCKVEWSDNVEVVTTETVTSHDKTMDAHGRFISEGYEGAILRLFEGLYLWGYRSSELLKVKEFQDAEFKVVSARDGKGKMAGGVIWTCKNDLTDGFFECTMKVTMDERKRFFRESKKYLGKLLTIRFFDRTDDSLPRFPVGIVFRDARDM